MRMMGLAIGFLLVAAGKAAGEPGVQEGRNRETSVVLQIPQVIHITTGTAVYGRSCQEAGQRRRNESMMTERLLDHGVTTLCAQYLMPVWDPSERR